MFAARNADLSLPGSYYNLLSLMPTEAMHAMERDRAKIDEKKAEIERLEADVPFLNGEERKERVR